MAYSKKQQKAALKAYRKAVQEIFGVSKEIAEDSIYLPEDDRGEWAPNSMTVVNFECGLPGAYEGDWCAVNDLVAEITGNRHLFMEPINGAVGAVYE